MEKRKEGKSEEMTGGERKALFWTLLKRSERAKVGKRETEQETGARKITSLAIS